MTTEDNVLTPVVPVLKQPTDPEEVHRQREVRFWRASLILSVIATIGAIVAAFAALRALKDTSEQAKAAIGQLSAMQMEQRAWIQISVKPGPNLTTSISEKAANINFDVTLQNVGHLPAQGLTLHFAFSPLPLTKSKSTHENILAVCKTEVPHLPFNSLLDLDALFYPQLASVLFPQETNKINFQASLTPEQVASGKSTFNGSKVEGIEPLLFVCVSYNIGGDRNLKASTGAGYRLGSRDKVG